MTQEPDENKLWWMGLAAACAGGPFLLLLAMLPLFPRSGVGWLIALLMGAVLGAWVVGSAFLIQWLLRRERYRIACRLAATAIAVFLGSGFFLIAYSKQEVLSRHFSYHSLKRR